ncbi:MAG: hypothetical protein AAFX76_12635 [Planctomycetota bacterium]
MSTIGTGVAASVAQVAHNAQQAARARDKARADQTRAARDDGDRFEQRLASPSQADDPDAELPDRQAPGYEQLYFRDGDGEPLVDPAASPPPATDPYTDPLGGPPLPGHPLYQHLDVKA